jgi:hypothetical protein
VRILHVLHGAQQRLGQTEQKERADHAVHLWGSSRYG